MILLDNLSMISRCVVICFIVVWNSYYGWPHNDFSFWTQRKNLNLSDDKNSVSLRCEYCFFHTGCDFNPWIILPVYICYFLKLLFMKKLFIKDPIAIVDERFIFLPIFLHFCGRPFFKWLNLRQIFFKLVFYIIESIIQNRTCIFLLNSRIRYFMYESFLRKM